MSFISGNSYGINEGICESILYLCESPAFIWSADGPRVLLKNDSAARFFRDYPYLPDSSDIDINKAIPDWRNIPDKRNNSVWLRFVDAQKHEKRMQVRNSCLDPEQNIWATALIDNSFRPQRTGSGFPAFFGRLEELWTSMTQSVQTFQRHQTDLYTLVISELGLKGFLFVPAESFKQYDFYPVMMSAVGEKNGWKEDLVSKLGYTAFSGKNCFIRHDPKETGGTAVITWAFDIEENVQGGFFCLEGPDPKREPDVQMVCEVLADKYRMLYDVLRLRKENYITRFENRINDIVTSNISEGVIITDNSFSIMYINPVASVMFGFSSSQVVGHKIEDLLVTSDGLQKLLTGDDPDNNTAPVQYLHRRSGKIFPCQIKACQMISGYDTYNIFVLSDQTETEESRLKAEQLTQKAFLGDFASMLAHEIRNPINNIQMWIANLYTLADGNEEFISGAKRVENDFQRITQLVNNILAFSKPITLNKEEIDLSMLISEIIEKWRLNFVRKNIQCFFSPPQDFPKIYGDPRSLEQVFNNLIGNSVDAFDGQDGIITLKLSVRESETGRKQVVITESDNGPGIPEDKIDTIFEPFMTTKKNGNGWGLALSKRIITSHKGTIQVKSFQGGTVFEILLPLNDENG